jgi:hypothetical protein
MCGDRPQIIDPGNVFAGFNGHSNPNVVAVDQLGCRLQQPLSSLRQQKERMTSALVHNSKDPLEELKWHIGVKGISHIIYEEHSRRFSPPRYIEKVFMTCDLPAISVLLNLH